MQVNQLNKAKVCRELLSACLLFFTFAQLHEQSQQQYKSYQPVGSKPGAAAARGSLV